MEGSELGKVTLEIVPTKHLAERCRERLDGIWSESFAGPTVRISGTLVSGRRPGTAYLDVDGIGRFVLALFDGSFWGITYLPEIHCHENHGEF
jgi:hypothetical protein